MIGQNPGVGRRAKKPTAFQMTNDSTAQFVRFFHSDLGFFRHLSWLYFGGQIHSVTG